ncbi:MAG: DUF551 domain-containing protein [Hominilimicola sp.]
MIREEALACFVARRNYNPHDGNIEAERIAISALRIQQESKPQRISVKDRLPDTYGFPCLLCGENAFGQICVFAGFTGYMERGKFEWHSNQKDIDIAVWMITHWMPMPEMPETEETEE